MNPIKLYTVKEAAKLIGVSTNTLYKYLDEGRIRAARGSAEQGRFRIPESALEEFLGIKLSEPTDQLANRTTESLVSPTSEGQPLQDTPITVSHNTVSLTNTRLPLKTTRLFLLLAMTAMLVDVIVSPSVSPTNLFLRIFFLLSLLILAYQDGGFRRRNT